MFMNLRKIRGKRHERVLNKNTVAEDWAALEPLSAA